MQETEHNYRMSWDIEARPKGYTKEDLAVSGRGGCDRLVLVSILDTADGASRYATVTCNGDPEKPMSAGELFEVFAHFAHQLAERDESTDLGDEERFIAERTFSHIRDLVLARRGIMPPGSDAALRDHVERGAANDE